MATLAVIPTTKPRRAKKYGRWSKRIERNLLAVWLRASDTDRSEGLYWYATAQADARAMATRHGVTLETVCRVIAVLSPGRNWGAKLD
jgi:hypothetical protein